MPDVHFSHLRRFQILPALAVLCYPHQLLNADAFTYTTIDVGPSSGIVELTSINDLGQIIGNYRVGNSVTSFLYDHGAVTVLQFPQANAVAEGINDAGEIVGYYPVGQSGYGAYGFVYANGVFTTLNVPGSSSPYSPQDPSTGARAINNLGQIVGTYQNGSLTSLGFLYSGGVYTTIAPGSYTLASGINDLGQIVGNVESEGFLYQNGVVTPLQVPGASYTRPIGINDAGQIVGTFNGDQNGFLYDNGTWYVMSLTFSIAEAINNSSQIVGEYDQPVYVTHGFEASFAPVPEPGSLLLLGSGLTGLILFRRRQRG